MISKVVVASCDGRWFSWMDGASGNSHSARELVYKSLDAADQAEVRRHAFMSCRDQPFSVCISGKSEVPAHKDKKRTPGRNLMPERLMAMTKGEAAAVPFAKARPGSFEGTSRLMTQIPAT